MAVVCGLLVTFYCAAGCHVVRQSGQLNLHTEASIEVVWEVELVNVNLGIPGGLFDDTFSSCCVVLQSILSSTFFRLEFLANWVIDSGPLWVEHVLYLCLKDFGHILDIFYQLLELFGDLFGAFFVAGFQEAFDAFCVIVYLWLDGFVGIFVFIFLLFIGFCGSLGSSVWDLLYFRGNL